jgi:hypothetical protein
VKRLEQDMIGIKDLGIAKRKCEVVTRPLLTVGVDAVTANRQGPIPSNSQVCKLDKATGRCSKV